jgi:hypothetical protein
MKSKKTKSQRRNERWLAIAGLLVVLSLVLSPLLPDVISQPPTPTAPIVVPTQLIPSQSIPTVVIATPTIQPTATKIPLPTGPAVAPTP